MIYDKNTIIFLVIDLYHKTLLSENQFLSFSGANIPDMVRVW
jgi:hypothetical protein